MHDTQTSQRARQAIAAMMKLAVNRAEAEQSLARSSKSEHAVAERQLTESSEKIETVHQSKKDTVNREYRAAVEKAKSRFDEELREVTQELDTERFRVTEKADHDEATLSKAWEEARWTAETVYEAKQPLPGQEFKKSAKMLKARGMTFEGFERQALDQLRRFRQRVPDSNPPAADHTDNTSADPLEALEGAARSALEQVTHLRRTFAARLFEGTLPFLIFIMPFVGAAALLGSETQWQFSRPDLIPWYAGGAFAGGLSILGLLYMIARRMLVARFRPLADTLRTGHSIRKHCLVLASEKRAREEAALRARRDQETAAAREKYEPSLTRLKSLREKLVSEIDEQKTTRLEGIETRKKQTLRELQTGFESGMTEIESRHHSETSALTTATTTSREATSHRQADEWNRIESEWRTGMAEVQATIQPIRTADAALFPSWDDDAWRLWKPPATFAPAVRFGSMDVRLEDMPGGLPHDERLLDVGPVSFDVPAVLDFPTATSMLIEVGDHGRDLAVSTLQNVMMRLLTAFPPGKVRFTIVDPVGLGQNFAGFMHLADYEEAFVADRIWTETRHIEKRLLDLTEHMENVIQKYLRNDFETITEYNEQAGEIAEPFRFLVIANFPVNFSDIGARRLVSIVDSGPRCGVYTLVSMDTRQQMPQNVQPEDLTRGGVHLVANENGFEWKDDVFGLLPLTLDSPPSPDFLTQTLHLVGASAQDSTRVEVPFEHVAPAEDAYWTHQSDRQISVPLGRAGATKLQQMSLGRGVAQHVLIAGKTGSGKSTLLHVLVTNLALHYRPDEVEFYLVDFKKGVEFKTYATHNLPHARAVAIESDREFGLSVLQRVDAELRRRGEIFRELGVQDLRGYRELGASERIPRTLLIIDEFQEFFTEDDKIAQDAGLLLDRLVRQGRAFGIHVLLGSQTLAGAYSLARSTIGQMAVRVALQCSEADAMLIMGDDNTAPRLLSRPGEAIYNDQGGLVEGNSPFQIVWLPDQTRETYLKRIGALASKENYQPPEPQIVFEGNVPADVIRNQPLELALGTSINGELPKAPRAWLGDAIAIKDPTAAVFRRQTGANLLMVGQMDEAARAIFGASLVGLAAQTPIGSTRFYILDATAEDNPNAGWFEKVADRLPHDINPVSWTGVEQAMKEIATELDRRQGGNITDAPPLFLIIYGLQRYRMLRQSDDFGFSASDQDKPLSPDKQFGNILRDGPPLGMHTLIWCDSVNNINRTLDRNTLREFDLRVLFQMSPADSSTMIDNPVASTLGQNRAMFHSEDHGVLEKFRPYALPPEDWLVHVESQMRPRDSTRG